MNQQKLYRQVYLIRASEDAIKKYYDEDEMKTPMHMSEGSEGLVAGVCAALRSDDQVFGTYRTHALYLAKTDDPISFFGELYGKVSGTARGKSGSMHLSYPEKGYMFSSAIVASTIPVAVGNAFANKMAGNNKATAAFFGDGATNEGNFWESLNLACLWDVPVLFVCEDNEFAVHTPQSKRDGYDNLVNIVNQYNCEVLESESTDVGEIYELSCEAVAKSRIHPVFLRLKYYRYLEHVGVAPDFDAGYRSEETFDKWFEKDPVAVARAKISEEEATEIENEVDALVEKSVQLAKSESFAPVDEVYKDVFHE